MGGGGGKFGNPFREGGGGKFPPPEPEEPIGFWKFAYSNFFAALKLSVFPFIYYFYFTTKVGSGSFFLNKAAYSFFLFYKNSLFA